MFALQVFLLAVTAAVLLAALASLVGTLISTPDDWEYELDDEEAGR